MNVETEISRDLWGAIRRSYESKSWTNAILDGVHFLSDAIRNRTGLQSDGTSLIGQAFGGKNPKLRLNKLQTESENNLQAGTEQLLRGIYQAIRNPRSHERIEDSQQDPDALILFIDYLCRVIGHAKSEFSIDEYVEKIFDQHFVPNQRYAELLVSEIPHRKLGQVAIAVYFRKKEGVGSKLKFFFDALIPLLADEEKRELFEAISEELRTSASEDELRSLLQIIDSKSWPSINEAARLRTENRIIASIRDGRYSREAKKCFSGALATWARHLWPCFSLKSELIDTIVNGLRSGSSNHQNYLFQYCFPYLEDLTEQPSSSLKALMVKELEAGDTRFRDAVDMGFIWGMADWGPTVEKAYKAFTAAEAVPDDIPF